MAARAQRVKAARKAEPQREQAAPIGDAAVFHAGVDEVARRASIDPRLAVFEKVVVGRIVELTRRRGHYLDVSPGWIANECGISESGARRIMRRLLSLRYLEDGTRPAPAPPAPPSEEG